MSRKVHFDKSAPTETPTTRGKPLCPGDHWYADTTHNHDKVTCPTCLGILDRKAMAARPADAPKIEMVKFDGMSGYRFTYKAMVNGNHVGFIVYDGAYGGGKWKITINRISDAKDRRVMSYELANSGTYNSGRMWETAYTYMTKERALLACVDFVAAGRLPTHAALEIEAKEFAARQARYQARLAQEEADNSADLQHALDAISSVLLRPDLSNSERDGLERAILRLRLKERA